MERKVQHTKPTNFLCIFALITTIIVHICGALASSSTTKQSHNTTVGDHFLYIHNCKTGEELYEKIIKNGEIIPSAHKNLNRLFRDHRQNTIKDINPKLIRLLIRIQNKAKQETNKNPKIILICGYRDPKTTKLLKKLKRNVATNSQHSLGNAADIYIKGLPLSRLREICDSLGAKGLGYYPRCGFVHIDVRPGKKARW